MLRENLGDFERVKGALGRDTIETIVQAKRLREQEIKEHKRAQRRKMDRGARRAEIKGTVKSREDKFSCSWLYD